MFVELAICVLFGSHVQLLNETDISNAQRTPDLKRKAQPLCDTSMTDSAHGFGAWSGNKTLVTHGWITRDNRSKAVCVVFFFLFL